MAASIFSSCFPNSAAKDIWKFPAILTFYFCCPKGHKFSGLQQHKCIMLQFCRSEALFGSHVAKIKGLTGLCFCFFFFFWRFYFFLKCHVEPGMEPEFTILRARPEMRSSQMLNPLSHQVPLFMAVPNEKLVFLPFPASRGCPHSLTHSSLFHLESQQ